MEHYLNFNLVGEPHRFHVSLPWNNLYAVNFNAVDAHLKSVVPEAMHDRTRKLKPSEHTPELESIDFHHWLRQAQTNRDTTLNPYQQELTKLVGGQVHHAGLTQDGYPYLIVKQSAVDGITASDGTGAAPRARSGGGDRRCAARGCAGSAPRRKDSGGWRDHAGGFDRG